ncbi:MAG: SCO family protein [Thermotogae bacterium]|nr:SCO family protein [Thermotogota bacterium]
MRRTVWVPLVLGSMLLSCGKGINRAKEFPYGKGYVLVNQNGDTLRLDDLKGKVLVVGYIYTHCPDICPFITSNMKKVQKLVNSDKKLKENVLFVSITFDPRRDSASVLDQYAQLYRVDTSNWIFLTGDQRTIDSLMEDLDIVVEVGPIDVSINEKGDTVLSYEIVHTDRIHVVDPKGNIVAYFKGSGANAQDVLGAIRKALNL